MTDDELTEKIIGCAYIVHNKPGPAFLKKSTRTRFESNFSKQDSESNNRSQSASSYDGQIVGEYYADLWVEERVVVELKAALALIKEHEVQLVNYLTATKVDLGLLLNFGSSVQVKRKFRAYKPKGSLLNSILPAG